MNPAWRLLRGIPLLGFALIAANLLALLGEGLDTDLLKFVMPSGDELVLHAGDLVVLAGLVLLFVEIAKATRTHAFAMVDHAASVVVLLVVLAELVFVERFAHGSIVALSIMSLIDVVAGFMLPGRAAGERPGPDREAPHTAGFDERRGD